MASYWNDILTAIKAQVVDVPGIPPVKRRKRPMFWNKDEKRVVCICPVSDELVKGEGTFVGDDGRRAVKIVYTVTVAILIQANEQYSSDEDDPETLEWRELIRQKLDQPNLIGAATVAEMDVTLGEVYDASALDKAYNDSRLTIVLESIEPANGQTLSTLR